MASPPGRRLEVVVMHSKDLCPLYDPERGECTVVGVECPEAHDYRSCGWYRWLRPRERRRARIRRLEEIIDIER